MYALYYTKQDPQLFNFRVEYGKTDDEKQIPCFYLVVDMQVAKYGLYEQLVTRNRFEEIIRQGKTLDEAPRKQIFEVSSSYLLLITESVLNEHECVVEEKINSFIEFKDAWRPKVLQLEIK